jgi:hypothetical protein
MQKGLLSSAAEVCEVDDDRTVALLNVSYCPLAITSFGKLGERVLGWKDTIFRFAPRGTPTAAWEANGKGSIESRAVHARLAAGDDSLQWHVVGVSLWPNLLNLRVSVPGSLLKLCAESIGGTSQDV